MTDGRDVGRVGLLDVGAFLAELAMLVALGYEGVSFPPRRRAGCSPGSCCRPSRRSCGRAGAPAFLTPMPPGRARTRVLPIHARTDAAAFGERAAHAVAASAPMVSSSRSSTARHARAVCAGW